MLFNLNGSFIQDVTKIFASKDYMEMVLEGLKCTLLISFGAALVGIGN